MCNDFETFCLLPDEMQKEAIREGEERVKAQLTVANNADQRALNWARLHIAAATAALGACVLYMGRAEPDYYLAGIALLFAILIIFAGWHALQAARPDREFHLPGNTPLHWLPDENEKSESKQEAIARSQREQAECLAEQIAANSEIATRRGDRMDLSYDFMRVALVLALASLLIVLIARSTLAAHGLETTVLPDASTPP